MHNLDQVRFYIPTGELVTVTVAVDRPGIRRGGPERRKAEDIAALLWMALQEEEAQTPTTE
jgi:hypothetical protein